MGTQIHAEDNYRRVVNCSTRARSARSARCWSGAASHGATARGRKKRPPCQRTSIGTSGSGQPRSARTIPAICRRTGGDWWDFGNGTLGDMACHIMDLAFWGLKLRYPTTIKAEGPPVSVEGCPEQADGPLRVSRPRRHAAAETDLVRWQQSAPFSRRPRYSQRRPRHPLHRQGGNAPGRLRLRTLYPQEKFKDFKPPAATIPNSIGHHKEFFEACKTGGPTTCNFDYSGTLTEAVLLGTVAYRVGKKLDWDPVALKSRIAPRPTAFFAPTIAKAGPSNRPCRRRLPTPIATVQVAGGETFLSAKKSGTSADRNVCPTIPLIWW